MESSGLIQVIYITPSLQGLGDITEEEAGKIMIARVMEGCYNTVSSGKVEVAAVINSSQSTSSMDEDGAPELYPYLRSY